VGQGKMPPQRVGEILASRDRNQAGATAPPQGLSLVRIFY
jgi:tRNA pseudouridine38-40 synthase